MEWALIKLQTNSAKISNWFNTWKTEYIELITYAYKVGFRSNPKKIYMLWH